MTGGYIQIDSAQGHVKTAMRRQGKNEQASLTWGIVQPQPLFLAKGSKPKMGTM